MLTWLELEARFRDVTHSFRFVRLDAQWGSSGEHWRLAGGHDVTLSRRFESLAALGGQKLRSFLPAESELLAHSPEPKVVWYRALWKLGGYMKHQNYALERDKEGKTIGTIYLGSIERPAEASAVFCLEASGTYEEVSSSDQAEPTDSVATVRSEEVLELKPNFFGLGVNLRALWRRLIPMVKGGGS